MHSHYSIKETVKVLTVTKKKQKIRFQIRHPENAKSIIGIAVTCDLLPDTGEFLPIVTGSGITAGYLSISVPQKGDIVFGDDVRLDTNDYSDLLEKTVYNLFLTISEAKKRDYYFSTLYKIDKAVLEGFYEDFYAPDYTKADGTVKSYLYKIRIYLRYQMNEVIQKEEKNDC